MGLIKSSGDSTSSWYFERNAQAEKARDRRKLVLERLKTRWRNASPLAGNIKPFISLADDLAAQHSGKPAYDPRAVWEKLGRSVSGRYFDGKHRLFIVAHDRMFRLTSKEMWEADKWGEQDENWLSLLHESWASVATIAEWSRHQRYELPIAWQEALPTNGVEERPKKREDIIFKGANTRDLTLQALEDRPRGTGEQLGKYDERISQFLKDKGITAGPRLVRNIREKQAHAGRNGISNLPKLPSDRRQKG